MPNVAAHMRRMATPLNTQNDQADLRVRAIARRFFGGMITESEARWQIAAELIRAGLPRQIAIAYPVPMPSGRRDELIDLVRELILELATRPDPDAYLDLGKMANGTSAMAWGRTIGKLRVRSFASELRRKIDANVSYVDPIGGVTKYENDGRIGQLALGATPEYESFHSAPAPDDFESGEADTFELVRSDYEAAIEGRTTRSDRQRAGANALRAAFSLPEAVRPSDQMEREWIRTQLAEDPKLAHAAAVALHSLISANESNTQREIDVRLLALWDDYTVENLETLIDRPAAVADAIAAASIARLPRPHRESIRTGLIAMRMQYAGEAKREWKILTQKLLDSWLATEAEARSDFSHTSKELTTEESSQRLSDGLAWPEYVAAAVAWEGSPLGSNEAKVSAFIRRMFTALPSGAETEIASSTEQHA